MLIEKYVISYKSGPWSLLIGNLLYCCYFKLTVDFFLLFLAEFSVYLLCTLGYFFIINRMKKVKILYKRKFYALQFLF